MPKRDLDLERKWRITFDEYKKSGQSVKGWCEKNGIIPTTFRYWIKRFTSEDFQPVNTQFAKVILQPNCTNNKDASTTSEDFSKTETTKHVQQTQSSEFQVFINNIRVIVPGDFSPAALAGLMRVLKTL